MKGVQSVNKRKGLSEVFVGTATTIVVLCLLLLLAAAMLVSERIDEEQMMITVIMSLLLSTILGTLVAIKLRTDVSAFMLFLVLGATIVVLAGLNIMIFEGDLKGFWWRSLVIVVGGTLTWLMSVCFKKRTGMRRSVKLYK